MKQFKSVLPDFPRTAHLPWKPNATTDDLIATNKDTEILFQSENVTIEEKIDGANCGMTLYQGHPIVRNSTHILRKGYTKGTPAKQQFANVFNWFYKNKQLFKNIGEYGVYGEWMVATHGIEYDHLPSCFIAFDVYDYQTGQFVAAQIARKMLTSAGFAVSPLLHQGKVISFDELERIANQPSEFTSKSNLEGIYLKVSSEQWVTHRFKMVRPDFVRGKFWDGKTLNKNIFV